MSVRRESVILPLVWMLLVTAPRILPGQEPPALANERLRAEFRGTSLTALVDLRNSFTVRFAGETFSVTVDGERLEKRALRSTGVRADKGSITFGFESPRFRIQVIYELRPGWAFVTKQLVVEPLRKQQFRVGEVQAFTTGIEPEALGDLQLSGGRFGALLRFAAPAVATGRHRFGAFFLYQNPFNAVKRSGQALTAAYPSEIDWEPAWGPFTSDRFCIGIYRLSGHVFPATPIGEWVFVADYAKHLAENPQIDMSEADAIVECVRSFLLYRPARSVRVHVPWCENDYQIDVAEPDGWTEYRRIIDRAAELGCNFTLFTPGNRRLSSLEENRDAWGWENILFFGMGQKLRKGEWDPAKDPVPGELQPILDYAKSKSIRLVSYSYPTLPFLQNPDWTRWAGGKLGGYRGADTGVRSFQDWWVDKLVNFVKATGAGGFSFDHWWIAYDEASSKYAQWFGCRRILETLRARLPDIVIDGRQQYMGFGPWTWLAGSYPHPTLTDEQPESFTAFPDLHTDRVSADRQRFAAWTYRMQRFTPPEIMPGYITHQTERHDAKRVMRRDRFRPRDWDLLGWKYSLLSSIASAPLNHVVDFIPARDADEFKALSEEDKRWFRGWLDWTDANAAVLKRVKPIIGQPMLGRIDGTAACVGDRGFVFLFNPNYRSLDAEFTLDASIGLEKGEELIIEELYPEKGRLVGHPKHGIWQAGDRVVWGMRGAEAAVFEIRPAASKPARPLLFNLRGSATLKGGNLVLSGVEGEPGTTTTVVVLLPDDSKVRSLAVNGGKVPFHQEGRRVTARLAITGEAFTRCQPLWTYDPAFTGGMIRSSFRVPARVFEQLRRRRETWPVPYTEDDLIAAWLGSDRLLLFAQIAEPDESMTVVMTIDGKPVQVRKAYNSIYGNNPKRTFLGSYADVSFLAPDADHVIEVRLPTLAPGQFQGLFFENVEPEYASRIR